MNIQFCSLASGSSGNSYLIRTEKTALLIDAGISASRIAEALVRARTDPDEVKGILITHEHVDHIGGLLPTARRIKDAQLFATGDTWDKIDSEPRTRISVPDERKEKIVPGDAFTLGDIEITPIALSHDAVQTVGYSLKNEAGEISVITDTGIFTEEMASATADSDVFVIEANHDTDMLLHGPYPPFLKQRILSEHGHLSNAAAARAILDIFNLDRKQRCVLLAHLSHENNDPKLAEQKVSGILADNELYPGRDLYIKALLRDRMSAVFEI